jgi:alanyl-tRNA synthetase
MNTSDIRQKFLDFYKVRKHTIIPSASLVPENDPTTLFTGSGMQPLVQNFLGQPHPEGKRVANSQKCFRAEDIDAVGDNRHTTFFEMLGNWSFGDYWKPDQLAWLFEFLTKEIGLKKENLYVTVFSGGEGIGRDEEAIEIWKKLLGGEAAYAEMKTEAEAGERGMRPGERIFGYGAEKNWWSRAGVPAQMPAGEPGGPDSEVFYDFGLLNAEGVPRHDPKFGQFCHPNCDCGRFLEIGNSVFMEYKKNEDGSFEKLKQRNVDFGGGLERITAAANNDSDIFHIDVFQKVTDTVQEEIDVDATDPEVQHALRVIADHLRASVFLAADGVSPGNKGRDYILRRLIRRAVAYLTQLGYPVGSLKKPIRALAAAYEGHYPELMVQLEAVTSKIQMETKKFTATLGNGYRELSKLIEKGALSGTDAFNLYQSYGYPWELTHELATKAGLHIDKQEFEAEFEKHRALSRTASAGTFKGGLADNSEKTTRLHTAHHLLLKALQIVLGPQVKQRGSNITNERLRMDFAYDSKMTDEQKKEVERIVNEKIAEDLPIVRSELPREEAEKLGAEHEFGQKYPERVSVYSIGPKDATPENPQYDKAFSLELCGGPHVVCTSEIGKFKIIKEEASSAGIRRIRGVIE